MIGLVVVVSGICVGEVKVFVDYEFVGVGVFGSEDSKVDDDVWCFVSMLG